MIKEEKTKSIPITKQMVWKTYQKVKRNGGSARVDGESLELFQQDLTKNLYKIWNRLSSGSYFPPAVKEVSIPKGNTFGKLMRESRLNYNLAYGKKSSKFRYIFSLKGYYNLVSCLISDLDAISIFE